VGAYICHGAVPTSREPCSAAQRSAVQREGRCVRTHDCGRVWR
jgi:hypothetical protein